MKRTHLLSLLGWAFIAVLSGCATSPPKFPAEVAAPAATPVVRPLSPELLRPPTDLFVLGPGDQLDIGLIGTNSVPATSIVGLDGKVYYSFLPGVDVWGLTLAQAKARLEKEFSAFYTVSPQLSLTLKSVGSKHVWLLGRLSRPGVYPMAGSVTLLEALALAGGTAQSGSAVTTRDLGDLRHSFVLRQGAPLPVDFARLLEQGDMSQNIYLKPDDFVFIPSSLTQEIYVLGAVAGPRTVPYTDGMKLISAIAAVGGPIPNAYRTHVGIIRGSLSQPKLIEADYSAIVKGKAPDVRLEPGDIVYMPLTPYHLVSEYADFIVTSFVRSWAANMGIRAVSGSASLGVSIPVGVSSPAQAPVVPPQ